MIAERPKKQELQATTDESVDIFAGLTFPEVPTTIIRNYSAPSVELMSNETMLTDLDIVDTMERQPRQIETIEPGQIDYYSLPVELSKEVVEKPKEAQVNYSKLYTVEVK